MLSKAGKKKAAELNLNDDTAGQLKHKGLPIARTDEILDKAGQPPEIVNIPGKTPHKQYNHNLHISPLPWILTFLHIVSDHTHRHTFANEMVIYRKKTLWLFQNLRVSNVARNRSVPCIVPSGRSSLGAFKSVSDVT